jgi:hypothetical protein
VEYCGAGHECKWLSGASDQLFQFNVVTSQNQASLDMIRPKLLSVPLVALIVGLMCGWMLHRIIQHGVPRWHSFLKLGVVGISSAALLFGLPLWLFSIFLAPPYPEIRVTAAVLGYQIEEVHYWTNYESSWLDLVVTRQDGKQYRANVGFSDRELCSQLWTTRIGTKIYFRCDDTPLSAKTPYVDSARLVLYGGTPEAQVEQALTDLHFADPVQH